MVQEWLTANSLYQAGLSRLKHPGLHVVHHDIAPKLGYVHKDQLRSDTTTTLHYQFRIQLKFATQHMPFLIVVLAPLDCSERAL